MERDRQVDRTGEDYAEAFLDLLPQGDAWPRELDYVPIRFIRGITKIWEYLEGRASILLKRESDPRITLDMLPDWERNFGLPDECYAEPLSIGDRQKALVQRMTIEGGQSRQFFIDMAATLGYEITITEFRPWMVGMDVVGDQREYIATDVLGPWPHYGLGPPQVRFYWTVHVGSQRLTWFRVGGGGGEVGVDPHLRIAVATDLECLLNRWKPAHTQIIFDYSGLEISDPMAGTP